MFPNLNAFFLFHSESGIDETGWFRTFAIEFGVSISNLGFDIDSGLGVVLVLVLVLIQT